MTIRQLATWGSALLMIASAGCSARSPDVGTPTPRQHANVAPTPANSPPAQPSEESHDAPTASSSTEPENATRRDVRPQPTPSAEPVQEAEPENHDPRLPPYVRILRRRAIAHDGSLRVEIQQPNSLRIRSDNVDRFFITRRQLPLTSRASVVLRIDDQVFEWTPTTQSLILERTRSAGWIVAERSP